MSSPCEVPRRRRLVIGLLEAPRLVRLEARIRRETLSNPSSPRSVVERRGFVGPDDVRELGSCPAHRRRRRDRAVKRLSGRPTEAVIARSSVVTHALVRRSKRSRLLAREPRVACELFRRRGRSDIGSEGLEQRRFAYSRSRTFDYSRAIVLLHSGARRWVHAVAGTRADKVPAVVRVPKWIVWKRARGHEHDEVEVHE